MMATLAVAIAVVGIATHRLMPPGTLTARPGQARLVAAEGLMGATVALPTSTSPTTCKETSGTPPMLAGLGVALGAIGRGGAGSPAPPPSLTVETA